MSKRIALDELELYIQILRSEAPQLINESSSAKIAELVNNRFNVNCSERDVFLLHEPTIEEEMLDIQLQQEIFKGYI